MRIRTRLLVLVLAILIPAFVAAAAGIAIVYYEAQQANRQALQQATKALGLLLDTEIEIREGMLEELADSPALDDANFSLFQEQARRTAIRRRSRIVLTTLAGEPLLDTDNAPGATGFLPLGDLRAIRGQYGSDETIVSNVFFSPVRGTYHFAVQVPVKRNGRVRYYLTGSSEVSELQSLMGKQRLPESWIVVVVDHRGTIVARSSEQEKLVGRPAREELINAIKESGEGFFSGTTPEGIPTLASYTTTPKAEWGLAVNVPQSELRRGAVHASIFLAAVSLLLLGGALFAAFLVAGRTARPIESLRAAAERMSRGGTIAAEKSGIGEIDAVHLALAEASTEIRNGREDLERRAARAVAQAERSHQALLQSQKLEALGRLTGGIAHDFNNVLQTLTSALQLAELSSRDGRTSALIQTCQNAVARAAGLTKKLLAFGRAQDAGVETLNLAKQIRESIPLLKQGGLTHNVELRLVAPDILWPVTLDKLQFEIALLNLTVNACEAMPQGGVLQLEAHNERLSEPMGELASGDYVRITLSDSGTGMSREVLTRAIDPFFTTKDVGKGSGMGLSQAYGFARQAGGSLRLHSQPGKGTQVIIYLPRARAAEAAPGRHGAATAAEETVRTGVVLFVEDDPLVREVVKPALEASGFHVRVAVDGEEAVRALESGAHVDYVFSDIVMPGKISGIDLAELVHARHPHIRVVLATGYTDRRVTVPHVRVLAKPYEVTQVIDALVK